MISRKREFCVPCYGGGGGGGGDMGQMAMMMMMLQQQMPKPPPSPNPAISASSELQPGAMAKNARVAAGMAGAYNDTLLTGPQGATPAVAGAGSKNVVGQ